MKIEGASKGWVPAAGGIAAAAGFILYGKPQVPSEVFGWRQESGAALLFCFWLLSIFAWGDLAFGWCRWKKGRLLFSLAFGTIWAFALSLAFGHAGLAGEGAAWLWRAVLAGGPVLWAFSPRSRLELVLSRERDFGTGAAIVVLLFVGAVALGSASLSFFQDPLWYHLVGPRAWFESGRIFQPAHQLVAFKTGSFEYLFMWGNALLGGSGGGGLVAGHLFGQWIHSVVGFGGTAVALTYLGSCLTGLPKGWIYLAVLGGLSSRELVFTAGMAKNDWGVIFWSLAGLALLASPHASFRGYRGLVAGLLIGLAFSGKFTTGFTILPFVAVWGWQEYRKAGKKRAQAEMSSVLCGFAIGALPVLIRNAIHTGNPFFPALSFIFPGDGLGPTWIRTLKDDFEGGLVNLTRPYLLYLRAKAYLSDTYSVIGLLLFPWALSAATVRRYRPWMISIAVAFLLFFLGAGVYLENRLMGPLNVLGAFLGVVLIAHACLENPAWAPHGRTVQYSLLALFALVGQVPWSSVSRAFAQGPPSKQLAQLEGWDSIIWTREHLSPPLRVLFAEESRTYYLTDRGAARIFDYPELDRRLRARSSLQEAIQVLRQLGFTHLLEVKGKVYDAYYDQALCQELIQAAVRNPAAVVFEGRDASSGEKNSMVVDLAALAAELRKKEETPASAPPKS